MRKNLIMLSLFSATLMFALTSCNSSKTEETGEAVSTETATAEPAVGGQSNVKDDVSSPNVVKVAIGSPDHTTLVAAVVAAELVDALSNNGPFTVFAPTNAAFAKLPAGTVEELVKPENKTKLQDILYDHVYVGVMKTDNMKDGQEVTMFGGQKVVLKSTADGKWTINGANIVASVPASNGIVHVVDAVLLRAAK